jgi:DNA-binding transcriptional ArsR family regulator
MSPDELDKTFSALADPTRRAILERLMESDADVAELAQPFDMSMPAISKHLKVLERAGLISRDREAQKRPSHLEVERLREATQWMERYRRIWEARMDRIEIQIEKLQQQEGQKK